MYWGYGQREKIIIAGIKLFTVRGVENTTMAAIQATAGVSVSTFYKNFRDKEDLANDIYRGMRGVIDSMLETAAVDQGSARAEFHKVWRELVTFHEANPRLVPFLAHRDHNAYLSKANRAISRIPQPMVDFLERLRREKIAKDVSAVILAAIVWGAFVELLKVNSPATALPSEEQFNAAEECAWDAIRKDEPDVTSPSTAVAALGTGAADSRGSPAL